MRDFSRIVDTRSVLLGPPHSPPPVCPPPHPFLPPLPRASLAPDALGQHDQARGRLAPSGTSLHDEQAELAPRLAQIGFPPPSEVLADALAADRAGRRRESAATAISL